MCRTKRARMTAAQRLGDNLAKRKDGASSGAMTKFKSVSYEDLRANWHQLYAGAGTVTSTPRQAIGALRTLLRCYVACYTSLDPVQWDACMEGSQQQHAELGVPYETGKVRPDRQIHKAHVVREVHDPNDPGAADMQGK